MSHPLTRLWLSFKILLRCMVCLAGMFFCLQSTGRIKSSRAKPRLKLSLGLGLLTRTFQQTWVNDQKGEKVFKYDTTIHSVWWRDYVCTRVCFFSSRTLKVVLDPFALYLVEGEGTSQGETLGADVDHLVWNRIWSLVYVVWHWPWRRAVLFARPSGLWGYKVQTHLVWKPCPVSVKVAE